MYIFILSFAGLRLNSCREITPNYGVSFSPWILHGCMQAVRHLAAKKKRRSLEWSPGKRLMLSYGAMYGVLTIVVGTVSLRQQYQLGRRKLRPCCWWLRHLRWLKLEKIFQYLVRRESTVLLVLVVEFDVVGSWRKFWSIHCIVGEFLFVFRSVEVWFLLRDSVFRRYNRQGIVDVWFVVDVACQLLF